LLELIRGYDYGEFDGIIPIGYGSFVQLLFSNSQEYRIDFK
jgi:hypothetical protein